MPLSLRAPWERQYNGYQTAHEENMMWPKQMAPNLQSLIIFKNHHRSYGVRESGDVSSELSHPGFLPFRMPSETEEQGAL